MFDKFKQAGELMKMRSEAQKLQKELAEIKETYEGRGIKVRVRGDGQVEWIELEGDERKDIVEAINKATKEVQKKAARKMMEMGGGLTGLLK